MPIAASRRKSKQTKKNKPNQRSLAAVQGLFLSEKNHCKMEEAPFNGTLQHTHKVVVEEKNLSEDNKEVVVQVPTNEEATQVESEDVSESVVKDSIEPSLNVSSPNEDTVVLELLEQQKGEDFLSLEDTDKVSLSPVVVANDEMEETTELPLSEEKTEVVETTKDMTVVAEEEKKDIFVLSSVVTEEPNPNGINNSWEAVETSDAKSEESEKVSSPKGIEKSLAMPTYEKVGEQSDDVKELSSSYESANESFQPSQNIPDAESNSVSEQDKIEETRSFENPIIVPLTQRQHTSWKSCCGLFEVLRHGDR